MGEKKFTLMELHLDGDTQFGPSVIPGILSGDDEESPEEAGTSPIAESSDEEAADEGRGVVPLIAGVLAMVAIAVAVRRYRNDEGAEAESFEERDVVVN